ncbi:MULTISPECIES: hypothetical protein [Sphingomonas]|uniref:hypothetical protein n=1 Tax=Sphingomonas TaxID=13687 RepID=UPI000830C4F8|nr:hypothetical protein [Sphingomonas sp. CCH10-B3]MBA3880664.1 hypothetical protein [Sphingobium sp.]
MQWAEMVVAIVLIVTIGKVLRDRHRQTADRAEPAETLEAARLRDEVRTLKERIAVLERLATDDNSNTARLDREIERLRDRS